MNNILDGGGALATRALCIYRHMQFVANVSAITHQSHALMLSHTTQMHAHIYVSARLTSTTYYTEYVVYTLVYVKCPE